ncbi:MAG TPA: hypothetical protein G4O03_07335 [Dehalococcoidia bacterium]|jgi:succinate dehydrogenase/fumarate reductase iron-sulfur protein|nr:hypothetical protein [Dehalococcoidia bacterium]
MSNTITVEVLRFDPDIDPASRYQTYEIPTAARMGVLSILEYIYENLDSSLAFRNYYCYLGICGSCAVRLNGKNVRACSVTLSPGDRAKIEPIGNYELIRDVVVDFGKKRTGKD